MSKFREIYSKVIGDKHEDQMAKFGSIIAQGILDAGMFRRHGNIELCSFPTAVKQFFGLHTFFLQAVFVMIRH